MDAILLAVTIAMRWTQSNCCGCFILDCVRQRQTNTLNGGHTGVNLVVVVAVYHNTSSFEVDYLDL